MIKTVTCDVCGKVATIEMAGGASVFFGLGASWKPQCDCDSGVTYTETE